MVTFSQEVVTGSRHRADLLRKVTICSSYNGLKSILKYTLFQINLHYRGCKNCGETLQFLQPFSIDSADFPCRSPAISSPRSLYGQNICSVIRWCSFLSVMAIFYHHNSCHYKIHKSIHIKWQSKWQLFAISSFCQNRKKKSLLHAVQMSPGWQGSRRNWPNWNLTQLLMQIFFFFSHTSHHYLLWNFVVVLYCLHLSPG